MSLIFTSIMQFSYDNFIGLFYKSLWRICVYYFRCNEHGQCKNGTCLCVTGWNGKHCTMEGCPSSCSGHGQCRVNTDGQWECKCNDSWDGRDCSVALEQNCNDGRDNDKGTPSTGFFLEIKQLQIIFFNIPYITNEI